MKYIESIRNKKVEEYVLITQIAFLLLTGILLVRFNSAKGDTILPVSRNVLLLIFPILGFILAKGFCGKKDCGQKHVIDSFLNLLYVIVVALLLKNEVESFFKFLMLMPVIVASLQYGTKNGYIWALITSIIVCVPSLLNENANMDIDVLVIGMIWLFAWLFGRMAETEEQIREELQRQASLDGLTGILNHRTFYNLLEEYYLKAKLGKESLSLMMIDLDFFKYYNDSYGHQRGDEVLFQLAKVIEESVGVKGFCARYGGDEFAVILPGSDGRDGLELGEKLRQAVEGTHFEGASILPRGKLTISVGVASYPENAESKEQLIEKADEALYKAKSTNSNRVELYYSVFDEIGHSLQDKEKDLLNSMRTLLMVINAKDRYTYGHSERVMHYAINLGRRMAMWEWEIQNLTVGALLHDIGKIEISREILNKSGKLDGDEWEQIKNHPIWGADMIRPVSSISGAVEMVFHHHENFDGTGYPLGIKGEEIPLAARILRLVDSFDAITSNRPYKKTLTIKEALKDMEKYRGTHYDPDVLDAFSEYIYETGVLSESAS